jgi:predicted DNA-binding protein (UPF0251 family)
MTDEKKLLQLVFDLDLHIDQAAKMVGVHRSTFYRWLSGESRIPKIAMQFLEMMKSNRRHISQ